jgi:superfamily I DNA and RNA helicase
MKGLLMGGSFGGTIIESTPNSFHCDNIQIITNVASPIADVLAKVKVHDFLEPELLAGDILVVKLQGQILGGVIFGQIQALIRCIKSGTKISVEVIKVVGGDCTIKILNA